MENNNLYRCAKINVECTKNDPVDKRAGGPEWLGFDFFVKVEESEAMIEFISAALASLTIPEENIYISGFKSLPKEKIWTKERILQEIKKDAAMLKEEATRSYSTSYLRK